MNFKLDIAGHRFSVSRIPLAWQARLPSKFDRFRVAENPAGAVMVNIGISDQARLLPPPGRHDLNETTVLEPSARGVCFRSDWCEGRLDLATWRADLLVHPGGQEWFGGIVENLLRLALAYHVLETGGVLLHSCAIAKESTCTVLFGHSGAGKSTAADLARQEGYVIPSDDINLLRPGHAGWEACVTPFGTMQAGIEPDMQSFRVSQLCRLRQSGHDAVTACPTARAVALLSGSAPFVNADPFRSTVLLENLARLANDVPVGELHFTRSARFVETLFPKNPMETG